MDQVILISPGGASGPLRGLLDRLVSIGVVATIVDDLAAAAETIGRYARPPALMLDLREAAAAAAAGAGDDEEVREVTDAIRGALEALPHALPIVVTASPTAALVVAAIRAGAGDVLDLTVEGTAAARAVVQRICQRQADRHLELSVMDEQRAIVEELLKDLIRTERRAIDAEDALAARALSSREIAIADTRPPTVLLVEGDRAAADELVEQLEAAGLATFAYVSGEEAIREAEAAAEPSGFDAALVAARLPGIDGIETVRLLREHAPELPAFLMTPDAGEGEVAMAEPGIVGFVQTPIADLDALVEQVAALARESRHRTRESLYLQRIKQRHEHVLERYRSLPRAL